MDNQTLLNRIEALEQSFLALDHSCYLVNLTQNVIPGTIYYICDGRKVNANASMGMGENARFSDVVNYWARMLPEKERMFYLDNFNADNLIARFRNGETQCQVQYWTFTPDHRRIFAERRITMFLDEQTGDVLAYSVIRDISHWTDCGDYREKLGFEQEMQEVRDLMQAARWTMLLDEQGKHKSIWFSKELRHMIGFENEEDFPNTMEMWFSRVYPEDYQKVTSSFKSAVADRTGNTPFDLRYRIQKKDGAYIWIRSAAKFRRNTEGTAVSCVGIFVDINDTVLREQMERRLMEVNEEQKNQLETISQLNREMQEGVQIFRSLGEIYSSMYYIDLKSNHFMELTSITDVHDHIGGSGNAQERFCYFCQHMMLPEYREEMMEFVDLSTLEQRFRGRKIITKEYRSTLHIGGCNPQTQIWRQACFIEGARDAAGHLTHVIFTTRSIHESKIRELESKERLQKANAEYAKLLAEEKQHTAIIGALGNIFFAMYYADLEQKTFQKIASGSSSWQDSGTVLREKEAVNRLMDRFVGEDYTPAMRTFLNLHTIDARLGSQTIITQEYEDKDGEWNRCSVVPVNRDQNGKLLSVIIGMRRISEEVAALESQDSLIQALAIPYENIYVVNGETGETVGYSMGQTMGERYGRKFAAADYETSLRFYIDNDVVEEDRYLFDRVWVLSRAKKLLSVRKAYSFIYRVFRNNALQYYQCQLVKPNQDTREFVIAFRNVTEETRQELAQQRRLEEALNAAETANKAKSEFLFNMSHDIRTPMNAIIGFTDLLEKHMDNRELARDYIKKIQASNEFLLSLINNVLDMARIESGKETLDETAWSSPRFCEELFPLFESQMREKNISFIHRTNIKHLDIYLDETKMRKVLLNILGNAQKYTPEGGTVTMTVTELPSDRPGYAVYQNVIEDNGIGMSKSFQEHLFEEFSRERTSTESRVAGTGLGMSIVKKLVELMQGTIEVESELGKGTRFTITIPHRIVEKETKQELENSPARYRLEDFAGKRILLAEDNELNAEIAIAILADAGFTVVWAPDGVACVDMVTKTEEAFDLILMDVQMPNMDGYSATRVIRKLPDRRKACIPILALTANAFDEDRADALHAGMNGHLPKPIRVEGLLTALAELLKQ